MIQRIQSVLLALAAILNFAVLFTPIWKTENPATSSYAQLSGLEITKVGPAIANGSGEIVGLGENILLTVHFALIILISLAFIGLVFLFKDRAKQMRFVYIGAALLSVQIILSVLLSRQLGTFVDLADGAEGTVQFGFFFAPAALILAWMAARQIRKDEELVKSADRFR